MSLSDLHDILESVEGFLLELECHVARNDGAMNSKTPETADFSLASIKWTSFGEEQTA